MTDLLRAEGLHKTYPDGKVHALNGVSFAVQSGENVAITGPSGCGKSTLLNLLGTLDRPDSGEIFFQGEPLSKCQNLDRFRATQIGFVFQSFFLLPSLTARENVQVPMFGGPLRAAKRAEKADQLLDLVGMGNRAGHRSSQLSVGERQRVALARAMANDPVLLLADEPTGNLDSDNASHVLELLTNMQQKRGLTLVMVTHSQEVADRADRVIRMKDGRIVSDRTSVLRKTPGANRAANGDSLPLTSP